MTRWYIWLLMRPRGRWRVQQVAAEGFHLAVRQKNQRQQLGNTLLQESVGVGFVVSAAAAAAAAVAEWV